MNSTRLVKEEPCKMCGADLTEDNCVLSNWSKNNTPYYRNMCSICYSKYTQTIRRKRAANNYLKNFDTEERLHEKPMQEKDFGKLCPGCATPITFDNCEFHNFYKNTRQYRRWCKTCFNYIKCALVNSRTIRAHDPKTKKRDPEKQRHYQRTYYEKHKERLREQQKEYYEKNKEQK